MAPNPATLHQLRPDRLWEVEMGGMIPMQVTDLAPSHAEGELAAPTRTRFNARPRRHLLGDSLARRS
jgi:hypothetical protein